jgi:multiple antibiotic resistance protein
MLLANSYGLLIPFIAITLSLIATWLVLYFAADIQRVVGDVVTDIMGKVLGMLVAAIAVKIVFSGIKLLI